MQAIKTTASVIGHIAAAAFVLWIATGGPIWKGKPHHQPAIKTFLPRE